MENLAEILAENARRNAALAVDYDPVAGRGCCPPRREAAGCLVPEALLEEHPDYPTLPEPQRNRLRAAYDFEFWAATCATIRDKTSGRLTRLVLNAPQRRLLAAFERQRLARLPIRVILLKARQWGGSTLVQLYMAWMQLTRHTGWNSLICGHRHDTSRAIKQMYRTLLGHYPEWMTPPADTQPTLRNVERSADVQHVDGRDCIVVTGTARSEDAARGFNLAMAHLSEVAYWPHSPMHAPEDVIRSVGGTVLNLPDTMVVIESTANGTGNYFHTEWLRARAAQSDKLPVFVPWHEIEMYRSHVDDPQRLVDSLDDYERRLWSEGCTLEMLQWYHDKRREYTNHVQMMAEFPSNDIEAFAATGSGVFEPEQLEALRSDCRVPVAVGDVDARQGSVGGTFVKRLTGPMSVWEMPRAGGRYLTTVDVGGRSAKADWSVIAVMSIDDLRTRRPEVVAQWRGHIDHDLLAWKAAAIARIYNNATLVIESNTLETEYTGIDGGEYVLSVLARHYRELYYRAPRRPGFHTNVRTKSQAIYRLITAVRERTYVERDHTAVDEMSTYETTCKGSYEARGGCHDDVLMTRAIALWVIEGMKRHGPITDEDRRALLEPYAT